MNKNIKKVCFILVMLFSFTGINTVQAKADDVIHFKSKNLVKAFCDTNYCEGPITKKIAYELALEDNYISLAGSLTQTLNEKRINMLRYDGFYISFDESENILDILKFYPDGKVINTTIKICDSSQFTDIKEREFLLHDIEIWFNYNYVNRFGYIKSNNGNIYFKIESCENGILYEEFEHIGLIKKNSLDLLLISRTSNYKVNNVYNFLEFK